MRRILDVLSRMFRAWLSAIILTHETASKGVASGAGSTHLPCSRIKSFSRSTASASGMLNFTAVLPTYRFTLPGAPPTYPKSASAISPGPFTMQPMIAILTPFRCDVAALIFAVVVCKLNSVRPQEGQATYSSQEGGVSQKRPIDFLETLLIASTHIGSLCCATELATRFWSRARKRRD